METLHHAIMSERWAREIGCDERMTRELVFWSMMPDTILATIGYQHRGLTHLEDDPSILGSQLHHTASDLSLIHVFPHVPILPDAACVAKVGLHLHLAQDRAYDEWLSRYIGAARDEQGEWAYSRKDSGASVSAEDVCLTKRWSWRCAWMETISEHLSDEERQGKTFARHLLDAYIAPARENSRWHPAMEESLTELWGVEMEQEHLPPSMADIEDDMRVHLERAWTSWQASLLS